MSSDETCHLYLIAHKGPDGHYESPVKIGITHSLGSRLKTLQTGNPRPIGLVFAFSTPNAHFAKLFERALHHGNAAMRLSGEWFDLSPRVALLNMVSAFWGILKAELGDDKELWDDAMVACGAVEAMRLLSEAKGEMPH